MRRRATLPSPVTRIGSALRDLSLGPALEQPLERFVSLFQRWNRSINLSAARTQDELHDHVIDSLHIVPHLRRLHPDQPFRVIDVGAGGGLPSVIAAICVPHAHITPLEPVHKKHAFLRTSARELGLQNLDPQSHRLEDHPAADYDVAMSRATFDLREWLLAGRARVRPGGTVFGFEAVPRADLPDGTLRHSYHLNDRTRAIVALQRPA